MMNVDSPGWLMMMPEGWDKISEVCNVKIAESRMVCVVASTVFWFVPRRIFQNMSYFEFVR